MKSSSLLLEREGENRKLPSTSVRREKEGPKKKRRKKGGGEMWLRPTAKKREKGLYMSLPLILTRGREELVGLREEGGRRIPSGLPKKRMGGAREGKISLFLI